MKMVLPRNNQASSEFMSSLSGGVQVVTGKGLIGETSVNFVAIPYFTWQNRGVCQMSTLLIENASLIENEQNTQGEINTDG